jgi:molecular chaperone DnaJ
VRYRQESFFGTIEHTGICDDCEGTGEQFSELCESCSGKKRSRIQKKIDIDIPAWIDNGMVIKITSEWNDWVGTKAKGDLYVKFEVETEEKWLKRDGIHLHYTTEIDLVEATLGAQKEIHIPLLWKRKIKISAGTQFGTIIKIAWAGVKYINKDSKGDLFITLDIKIPKKLSKKEKEIFYQLAKERGVEVDADSGFLGGIFT